MTTTLPPSPLPPLHTLQLTAVDAPLLQRFFDDNPAYFLATTGKPAGPGEALEEITGAVPPDFSHTKKWVVGYAGADGSLVALANVVTDLLATSVFHIGTFIVATARHGRGDAQILLQGLEDWARAHGAHWMRLGVVRGNTRAERFWARQGYVPVRERHGIAMGARHVTVRCMIKPLHGGTLQAYLALVPRDLPEPDEGALAGHDGPPLQPPAAS